MSLTPEEFTFELQDRVCALLKGCEAANAQGLSRMVLVKTWRRPPKRFDRARIMPGLYGRVIGSTEPGKYIVDVLVADVVSAMEKIMKVTP